MSRLTLSQPAALDLEMAVADFEEVGRRRPEYDEFVTEVRSTAIRPLVILYCLPASDQVRVLRSIDGRRDRDALLLSNQTSEDEP